MDRIGTVIAKVETIERLSGGALNLANADITLTSTMNNLIAHFLKEWPTKVSPEQAKGVASEISRYIIRPEGLRAPTRERLEQVDPILVPLLTIRYLLRHKHVQIVTSHLGEDWSDFCRDYMALFEVLE